jgi:release factor glutamine methyltransferase
MPEAAALEAALADPALPDAPATLREALRSATAQLRRAGIEDAGGDARRLAAAVLGLSRVEVLTRLERALAPAQVEGLRVAIARRCAREPVSRIIGERDFYGRSFIVTPATLDPRPDSETLIEATLGIVRREGRQGAPLRILDVGTGTGCLLLTLIAELPQATGLGTDLSRAALEVAAANARRLDLEARCGWLAADALDGVEGHFDILVSNPPYIRTGEIGSLEAEVRLHDPLPALDGGPDGLTLFRRLAAGIPGVIPDGWVILEVAHDQADAVVSVLAFSGLSVDGGTTAIHRDVAGRRRCVAMRPRG